MPPEEFRRYAHEVVDWIADYLAEIRDYPVLPDTEPGALRAALPPSAPETGEEMSRALEDFRRLVVPGITHWNHPSFHGYFAITGSAPGILGEMLAAALNVNAMVWRSSPAATELEEHVLGWVREMLGLPGAFMGTINDTASHSTLYALAAAREQALPEARDQGLQAAPPVRVYLSQEAHSSVDKAVLTLGLGRDAVCRLPTNEALEMDVQALEAAIREDRRAGIRPVAVVATLGTTSTTAVDPVGEVSELCRREGIWLHVDAAYGGPLALLSDFRERFQGWERADSIVVNPHKWLFTPVDCSILYCRRPELLRAAFSLTPEYLKTAEAGGVTNLMDYGAALGRRFRSLKLWFVLRYFGQEGIRARLQEHLDLARAFVDWVEEAPGWELLAPSPMATPVFRYCPQGGAPGSGEDPGEEGAADVDALNEAIMESVNRSGTAFLSHTRVRDRYGMRLSIGNLKTTRADVARVWRALQEAAEQVVAG